MQVTGRAASSEQRCLSEGHRCFDMQDYAMQARQHQPSQIVAETSVHHEPVCTQQTPREPTL